MKKLFIIGLLATLVIIAGTVFFLFGSNRNSWVLEHELDEFGDETEEIYITMNNDLKGTYSDSTTAAGSINWNIIIDTNYFRFKILKDGTDLVQGEPWKETYSIIIRDDNGVDYSYSGCCSDKSLGEGILVLDFMDLPIIRVLASNKNPRIIIKLESVFPYYDETDTLTTTPQNPVTFDLGALETRKLTEIYEEATEYYESRSYKAGMLGKRIEKLKDSSLEAASISVSSKAPEYTKVGDTLVMGKAPSFIDVSEEQNLTWKVLDVDRKNKKVLVISEKVLTDLKIYLTATKENEASFYFSWAGCDVNYWLNHDFIIRCSLEEISITCNEDASWLPSSNIFLLSANEANYYLSSENRIAYNYAGEADSWWLRSQESFMTDYNSDCIDYITANGELLGAAFYYENGIRPAFWLDME